MTRSELCRATWIPHPPPGGPLEEVMAPWVALGRVLTCVVDEDGNYFVLAKIDDRVTESWKVLT